MIRWGVPARSTCSYGQVFIVAVVSACSSSNAERGELDAGSQTETDAAAEDAGATACETWCTRSLECRIENVTSGLSGRVFDSNAACGYYDDARAQARCIAECTRLLGDAGSEHITEPCLDCERENFERSCSPFGGGWTGCRAACSPAQRTWLIEYALRRELVCWATPGTDAPPACRFGGNSAGVEFLGEHRREINGNFTGTASVTSLEPLVLQTIGGPVLRVHLLGAGPALSVGELVSVRARSTCPFWCEAHLVLERNGRFLFAAWRGNREMVPAIAGLNLSYRPQRCPSLFDDCVGYLYGELVATTTTGSEPVAIGVGNVASVGDFEITNGSASILFEHVCTDHPAERVAGAVIAR